MLLRAMNIKGTTMLLGAISNYKFVSVQLQVLCLHNLQA